MSQGIKITRAYCVEFDKIMDIDEVHRESMKQGRPFPRFNFLCSDEKCRSQGVQIVAAAYDKSPSERKVSMYFREHSHHQHHPDCEWIVLRDEMLSEAVRLGETEQEAVQRRESYTKLNDFIQEYIPKASDGNAPSMPGENIGNDREVQRQSNAAGTHPKSTSNQYGHETTTSFSRLVRHHYDMQKQFSIDKIKQMPLKVRGIGKTTWFNFFSIVHFKQHREFKGVTYGFLKNKIYPTKDGKKIYFKHKIDEVISTCLIFPHKFLDNYRHRSEIDDSLDNLEKLKSPAAYFCKYKTELLTINDQPEMQFILEDPDHFRIVSAYNDN